MIKVYILKYFICLIINFILISLQNTRASLSIMTQEDFFMKNFKNLFDTNSKKETDHNIKEYIKYIKLCIFQTIATKIMYE